MLRSIRSAILLAAATPLLAQRAAPPSADLIVTNAKIYTVDDNHPFVSAMAVRDGRIQFVGSEREALLLKGASTKMLDARGQT